ncbi:MAG: M14 family metallopeptidase [Acidobacteriota bacterium]
MHKRLPLILVSLLFIALSIQSDAFLHPSIAQRGIPAPENVLGFRPGDDRKLASWAKIVEYFQKLDAASDRVKFEEIGKSTMGAPFVYATISAPENFGRLDEFKEIQRQLADPRILGSPRNPSMADRKARALITRGKTVVLITCGIHSTEVGSTLSSTLIAHQLASSNEPEIQEILRNTIILLVPSLNPDGVDIVKNWYDKTLGTPYEGTEPPELYHKYVGHDNNRDWYAFTQVETQLTVDKIHNVWHPQIVHDIHQMGATGARLFLPPYMPPVEPNVPKQIVEGYTELGNWMAGEMRKTGFQGITTNSIYDAWTPARAYSHYHGGVRILSETASARLATPINVKFEQLTSRQGFDAKKESANFGPVWRGGEWKLRDITNYMTTGAFTLLKHASQNRERWLTRFYEIGKEAVRPRKKGELFGFLIPDSTNSGRLIQILDRAQVEHEEPRPESFFVANGRRLPEGTVLVRMDQPYGAFGRALLQRQSYPNLRNSEGTPIAPYDVTAHTLPLLMGAMVEPVYSPFRYPRDNRPLQVTIGSANACAPAPLGPNEKRRGLYKSHVPSMDRGWTQWILDDEGHHYDVLDDQRIRRGKLAEHYASIIIPDQTTNAIINGHRKGAMPDEYTGGIGEQGVKALREFVEAGGTLIFLNRASDFAIEQFKLPVKNVVDGLPRTDFFVPGSILRIELDTNHPIAKGMPKESIAWFENSPVFEVINTGSADALVRNQRKERAGAPALPVKIIAWYPKDRDPLLSGWLLGGDRIKGKAALVEVALSKGRIILFGFRPQYRAQSLATYPLLFNAISRR